MLILAEGLLAIVDRCIALLLRREETSRALFSDFVEPAFADFGAVHQDYLESFRRYREVLKDVTHRLDRDHPIFDLVESDVIFSEALRTKVRELGESYSHPRFGPFLGSIYEYLMGVQDRSRWMERNMATDLIKLPPSGQYVLSPYSETVREIFSQNLHDDEKRKLAIGKLDRAVKDLQKRYRSVVNNYNSLKAALLLPK